MKSILLTGGRAPVTLELARMFAQVGHRVIVAESMLVHLCRYSRWVAKNYIVPPPNQAQQGYIDALVKIIQSEHIDLLIPTCEEIFFVARGLERLKEFCTVFAAPIDEIQRLHNKWTFNQLVHESGLPAPRTQLLCSQADLQNYLGQQRQSFMPCVLKLAYSRFATQVHIIDDQRQFERLPSDLAISESSPWLAQEKIEGQAFCSYSIAHKGKLIAHALYPQTFTSGQLGACIHFQAVMQPDIDEWVRHFLEHSQFSGQIAFDFIISADKTVYALECNPRATSGAHLFQSSEQLEQAFLCPDQVQDTIRPQAGTQAMIAVAMLIYGPAVIFRSWTFFQRWLYAITHARDVIFERADPRPFLAQPLILWYNWRSSRQHKRSMLANSTYDIEWNGQV